MHKHFKFTRFFFYLVTGTRSCYLSQFTKQTGTLILRGIMTDFDYYEYRPVQLFSFRTGDLAYPAPFFTTAQMRPVAADLAQRDAAATVVQRQNGCSLTWN